MGSMMKTGSTGVDKYSRPSVGKQKLVVILMIKHDRTSAKIFVSLEFLRE